MPGFRNGKVPRNVIEKTYGEGVLYDEAFNIVAEKEYAAAIEENELEVDNSLAIKHGDYSSDVPSRTQLKVNFPANGMIRLDEEGLYIDGNFNFGDDYKINN